MSNKTKTPMIKSACYNKVARYFHPKDDFSKLSDAQKLEAIEGIIRESRQELYNYKTDRKQKRKVQELRDKRGVKPKKRTSKQEWEEMQNKLPHSIAV